MYDLLAVLDAAETLLASLTGVQRAQVGIPMALSQQLEAAVILGPITNRNKAGNSLLQREISLYCALAYAVGGEEGDAEMALAAAVDDLTIRFYVTRGKPGVPGIGLFNEAATGVTTGELDLEVSAGPNYPMIAGEEIRQFPFVLRVTQQANITDFD